jgi:serine/threonine protein kinase
MKFIPIKDQKVEQLIRNINEYNSTYSTNESLKDNENLLYKELSEDLVGTAEYVSPEVLSNDVNNIGPAVDLWALGCMIYLFYVGVTPFKDKTDLLIFDKILNKDPVIPEVKLLNNNFLRI